MDIEEVNTILEKYKNKTEMVINALQDIQDRLYYLPEEVLKKVSEKLNVPLSRVYSIATFYNAFSLVPKGKNQIKICMGTTCYVRGGEGIMKTLEEHLKIKSGETTEDKKFSIETVHCLGCCSIAPIIMVNKGAHGRLREETILDILKKYQ